jgi:plasmid stabilization system protein ParE
MAFRVKITPKAEREMDVILTWLLAHGAGDTGVRWFRGLREAINSLSELPTRCSLAPENAKTSYEVRQLLYGHKRRTYRILFVIREDLVEVLDVRGPRQNPVSLH